jgi:hypothetical protein
VTMKATVYDLNLPDYSGCYSDFARYLLAYGLSIFIK